MADENTFDPSLLDNEDHRSAAIEKLTGSGFVVKPKEEYEKGMNEFLKGLSHEDERVNHLVGPVVRREREAIDNLAKELFPDAQKAVNDEGKTESHLEFLKRNYSQKVKDLEEKAKKGISGEQVVKDFDDYKATTSKKMKTLEQQLADKDAQLLQKDITFDLNNSIAKREGKFSNDERIKPLIQKYVDATRRSAMEMKPEYRQIGDNKVLVFIDENGSIKYKDGNPYTVDRFVEDELAPILEQGRQLEGAGTGADKDSQQKGFVIPDTIKTQVQLDDYIKNELKLSLGNTEVLKKRADFIKEKQLPIK